MLSTSDVAREAGVSRATVSYVLNDRRDVRVSEKTRQRVLDVAQRLGYSGSPAARALRTGRGDIVLLLVPDWEVSGPLAILLEQVGKLVFEQGLMCVRYEGHHWAGSLDQLLARIPAACVVTLSPLGDADARTLVAAGLPEVKAWLLDTPDKTHTSVISQDALVEAQVAHLIERGYQRLAFLGISEPGIEPFALARSEAFRASCRRHGVPGAPVGVVDGGVQSILPLLSTWAGAIAAPLGVVAFNDNTALGVITAAQALGLTLPDQVGVIGCDDTMIATLTSPPMTSVRYDLSSEADTIATRICDALGMESAQHQARHHSVTVMARESTAAPVAAATPRRAASASGVHRNGAPS